MKNMTWGDLISLEYGKPVPDKESINGPIPVYGTNGQIGTSFKKPLCPIPSFIVGRKGAYRGVHFSDKPFSVIDTAFFALPKTDNINLKWAYYKFLTYNINAMDSGSAIPSTDRYELYRIKVEVPKIEIQQKVVAVLCALDKKISSLTKINHNLEEQAKAIFKSWFVDFEPFRDGKFVETEYGSIPKSWSLKTLGEVTEEIRTKVKNKTTTVFSAIKTGELTPSEEYFTKQVYSKDISKYIEVTPLTFAYNPARVNIGSLGLNKFSYTGCVSPVYVVFKSAREYHHFFDFTFKRAFFREEVRVRASGSVRQSLSYDDFSLIKIIYPPYDVVKKFNQIYEKISASIKHNQKEIQKLAQLRDALLPKLMSGEIDVSEVQV